MKKVTRVVGAVIFNSKTDSFFLGQRSRLKKHPLKWEFIGGKVEDEDILEAAEREFEEEVGRKTKALRLLHTVRYDYGGNVGIIEVNFVECEQLQGIVNFDKSVYETCSWIPRNQLLTLDWIKADRKFAKHIADNFNSLKT